MVQRLEKIAAFIAAQKRGIATIAIGHTFNYTFDWFFNYPLYMFVVEKFGLINGYILMAVVSFFTCLVFIKFYDWLKVDWLGIEAAKEAQEFGPQWIKNFSVESRLGKILWWPFSKISLLILWAIKRGGWIAFLTLSIYADPFIVTVYMRNGCSKYNGLSRRDWIVFLGSSVVSNAYWAIRTFAIIEMAKFSWKFLVN